MTTGGSATNKQELIDRDLKLIWHPRAQMKDAKTLARIPIPRGDGVWPEDFEGNCYIDAVSFSQVNMFGQANPIINARIKQQLDTLAHVKLASFSP